MGFAARVCNDLSALDIASFLVRSLEGQMFLFVVRAASSACAAQDLY